MLPHLGHIRHSTLGTRWIKFACLLVFFLLTLDSALAKAPTVDEPVHLLRGRVLWQTRELSLQTQPPLSHWVIGSLLFTNSELPDVTQLSRWSSRDRPSIAHEFLWESGIDVTRVILLARFPIILVGLLLGAMLARWARELSGERTQITVMLLFAFSPNLIAFSSLATTDLVISTTYLAVMFSWWRYWQRPDKSRWCWAAICLGLALSAKLTALLLLPLTFLLGYHRWPRGQAWWRPGLIWSAMLPITGLVLWVLYGFEFRPVGGLSFSVPAATYLDNFIRVQGHITGGHRAFLLGDLSQEGWWHYFVVVLLLKTPLPILFLAATAVTSLRRRESWRNEIFLWLPATALFVVASYTRLNIGYRHILPVLPFLLVWGAGTASGWWQKPLTRGLLLLMLSWHILVTLGQHPHHLAYLNEIVGGSDQAYKYLGDSNLDWGQDVNLLAEYVSQDHAEPVHLAYFGSADLSAYGIAQLSLLDQETAVQNFPAANPAGGLYAISASHVQGISLAEPDLFDWFRRQEPIGHLGYSILLYRVADQAAGEWIAHCLDPIPLLDPEEASSLVGQAATRHLFFDCRSTWVIPEAGQPGWYILPLGYSSWSLATLDVDEAVTVYSHTATKSAPSFDILYQDGSRVSVQTQGEITQQDGSLIDLPIAFGNTAWLVGYSMQEAAWWTVWQVLEPDDETLSITAHFYGDEPTPIVADGLGFSSEQWQKGDLFIQAHAYAPGVHVRFLETGLYNYLTGEPVAVSGYDSAGDRVRLYPGRSLD
jgi:hypothetical protein